MEMKRLSRFNGLDFAVEVIVQNLFETTLRLVSCLGEVAQVFSVVSKRTTIM